MINFSGLLTMANFDVFLSHNSKDKPVVRQIAARLRERGVNPWLDEEQLRPGLLWQDGLQEAIHAAKAAAVCLGPAGCGDLERAEIGALVLKMFKQKLPVVPVLLPGAPETLDLGIYLDQATWVNLRAGLTEEGLNRLYWGITGKKYEPPPQAPLTGPTLHNLPFPPLRDLFKGRDEDLRRLESALDQPGRAAAITQSEAISGLGGIGKTRLAVEHAWRCGHRYTAVFFVRADSSEALRRGLASLAGPALLNLPERVAPAEEEVVASVLRWLHGNPGWLLILDNVDTRKAAGAVSEILPSLSRGRVLITSRLRNWPATVRTQGLKTIPRDEATLFLLQRTDGHRQTTPEDSAQANRLADLLGDFPLVLEQAAAYIAYMGMRFADYLEAWNHERQRVLEWHDSLMEYPFPVAVTWQTTFEQLGPTSATLLRLTAFLAPDPVLVAMFEEGAETIEEASAMFCEETGRQPAPCPLREALAELAAYSMVTLQDGGRFVVHRMVQEVLRRQIPQARERDWMEQALRVVDDFAPFDADDVRTWPVWDDLRPHAAQVVALADSAGLTKPTAGLMNQLALLLISKALYDEAEPMMRRALAIDEQSFGTEHPNVARDLNNLAQLLKDTNRLSEAEPLMRRALAIAEQSFGPEHPSVAIGLNNLASLLQATNRLSEAEPLMRRALAIDEQSLGLEHPNVARDLNNLAQLLQATNRLSEAEPLMRRALAIDEQSLGPEHPNVARDLNNLAQLLQDTNRLSEAEPMMWRALAIDEQSFGTEHPNVAIRLNNLAQLLQDTNRLPEAEPLMRRAIAIGEQTLGPDHPNVAIRLNNLASLLKATNRLSEAEPLMWRALAIDEQSLGAEHPNVAIRLINLALFLQDTDRLDEAESLLRRAVDIRERFLPPSHPKTEKARRNLAALLEQKDTTDA